MLPSIKLKDIDLAMLVRTVVVLGVLILTGMTLSQYRGSSLDYLVFTVAANGLLYFGFRKNAIFFDTFIGVFFWLGFWLKLSVRVTFMASEFHESVGNFDGSPLAFDSGLLVATCGLAGLICASYFREKYMFNYPEKENAISQLGLHAFYTKYRTALLLSFVILIAAVTITNYYYGIYQRGNITRTTLPFGLNGVFKWLLIFGMASFSALVLKFEYFDNRKDSHLVAFIALLETAASSVSLVSRAMILNAGALVYGFYRNLRCSRINIRFRVQVVRILLFFILFVVSVVAVNYVRATTYMNQAPNVENRASVVLNDAVVHTRLLLLDRWVGIEGVFAVSSYPDKGWDLWWSAWREKYSESVAGFYDSNLIDSPYKNADLSKHHFLSLPGIVAFCFYPGSYIFLFLCMFMAGLFAFLVELLVFKLGGRNLIFCALIAQVVVFRYSNFGYVPAQSYLLFGSILLNVIMIFLTDKVLVAWYRHRNGATL